MTHDATDLDKRLAAVGRRITLRRALQESADFIPAVVLTGFALGIADHLIRFSVPGRWAELLIFLFVISFALVRMAVRIIRQPRSRKAAAEHIESLDPRFGGRLLSYVCFRGSTRGTAGQASPALIAAMCRRIEEQTRDLDAARLVPLRRLRFRFLAAAATVLAALTIILVEREAAQTWFIRISHPQVAVTWPARTRIGGLQPAYRVRRGDRLRVTGHISGRIPAAARLELWSPASENHATRRTTESMSVSPDGSFSASIGPLIQSAAMRLHAGDAHTPIVPIEVTFPPGLSSMKWVCYYPEFMNRPPEQLLSRDIRAPVGSRVELSLTADKPVRSIELAIRNHSGLQREPVPLTADYQGAASFIIRSPGWYQIALTDLDGITDDDPPTYRIVPIENPRPTVTLLGPPAELTVTPSARVPIEFEAEDGPTVTAATIVWRRPLADTADTQPAARVPIPLPGPAKNIRQSFEWALASIESRPGELLSWYIEVDDQAEHMNPRRPGEGMSGACTLSVVDTATFIRQHQDRLQAALNEIDDLAAETARSWDEVSAILNLLENKKPPPGTDLPAQLRPVHERQALSAKRLQALIGSIEHLLTEWTFSFPAGTAPRGTQLLANILVRAAQGPLRNLLDDWDRAITQSQASPESRPALGSTLRQIQQHQTSLLETLAALSGARPKASSELSASGPARENVNIQANAFEQLQTTLANNMERIARVDTPGKSPKVSPGRRPPRETPPPAAPVAAGSRNGRAVPATGATGTIVGHRDLLPMAAPVRADPGSPPWYWRLPDRQREILRQATTEPLPPDHAEAIRLYYDLLNQLSESQP